MKKLILTVVAVGLAMMMVTDASAGIFFWRRWRPVYVQPAPATGQVQPGRAFSYQPTPAPTLTYRAYRSRTGGHAYENAINKSLGRGF